MRVSYFEDFVKPSGHPSFFLPPMGMRIIKTALAVFICFAIYVIRNYQGMISESIITTVLCIQPFTQDSIKAGKERWIGTVIGAFWGLVFLLILKSVPVANKHMIIAYFIISLGVLVSIYSTVILKMPYASALAAITILCVTMSYPNVSSPLQQTYDRIVDTMIGVIVGVTVNYVSMPRRIFPNRIFFVRFEDLVSDRMDQMSSKVLFTLGHLYKRGAKICLMTNWAPAFLVPQVSPLQLNVPLIVMGGAAMYDARFNHYIHVIEMEKNAVDKLENVLNEMNQSYSVYAIREDSMMIYRYGHLNEGDEKEYSIMRRSPYRNYLSGSYEEQDKIAGIQILVKDKDFDKTWDRINCSEIKDMFDIFSSKIHRMEGYTGIYFKDKKANYDVMEKKVMEYLHFAEHTDVFRIVPENEKYDAEQDAMRILGKVRKLYEPISFSGYM